MPRSTREMCRCCWRPSPVAFLVPDAIWEAAVHPAFRDQVLCVMCFACFADERLVEWDRDIRLIPTSAVVMMDEEPGEASGAVR